LDLRRRSTSRRWCGVACSNFLARGAAQVQLMDPLPSANRGGCFLPALTAAKTWFDSLKQ